MRFVVLLLACGAAFADMPVDPDFDAKYEAWEAACTVQSKYSCEGLKPPTVRLTHSRAWRGGYNGDNDIVFNPDYPKDHVEAQSTRIHEMLHYIEYKVGGISYQSQKDICDTENFAYTTVNRWLEQQGRTDLQIHDWWESQEGHRGYWKCIPWYAGYEDFVVSEPGFNR